IPPKTIKAAIKDSLEDLTEKKLNKFRAALLDRRGSHALVSTFTESGALQVTAELLTEIGCNEEAQKLGEFTQHERKQSYQSQGPSAGASAVRTMSGDRHFVDRHRTALIQRVNTVPSLLDELLDSGVINQESYNTIMAQATSQARMRELYSGPLNASGTRGRDIFYEILEELEPYLISDLRNNYQ
uniref:CARD domain-containing protein n=1 Tax=Myripristis murdjan TaxID=586833 RepID=A0A667WTB2_9TELE